MDNASGRQTTTAVGNDAVMGGEAKNEKLTASARRTAELIWRSYWAEEATAGGRKAHREALQAARDRF